MQLYGVQYQLNLQDIDYFLVITYWMNCLISISVGIDYKIKIPFKSLQNI